MYSVVPAPEKLFVDRGLLWVALANKDEISSTLLTIIYRAADTGFPYIKRSYIETWIIGKDYSLIPEGGQLLLFSTEREFEFTLSYAKKPRTKKNEESFKTKGYTAKGMKSAGVRLATRVVVDAISAAMRTKPIGPAEPELRLELDDSSPAPAADRAAPVVAAAASKTAANRKTVPAAKKPPAAPRKKATPPEHPAPRKDEEPKGLFAALARKKAELASEESAKKESKK